MSKGGATFLLLLGLIATIDFAGGIWYCMKNGNNFVGTLCVFGLFFSVRLAVVGALRLAGR